MPGTEQEPTLNVFELESDDLREPDGAGARWQPWPSRAHAKQWLKQRGWALSALLALLVIILSLAGALPTPRHPAPPAPTVIRIEQDGLSCMQALIWSPDSRRVAMLGYFQECPFESGTYQHSLLNIYDASSGRLLRELEPDTPILAAIGTPPSAQTQAKPIIYYTALLWSRQMQQLALPFSIVELPERHALRGLLLLDENGRHERVLLQHINALAPYDEWDVQRGTLVHTKDLSFSPFFVANLPTAPAYHWGTDGALLPSDQAHLTASSGRIGNPVGDASFSFWQPGQANLLTSTDSAIEKPGVYLWESFFSAWSPDGRYLLVPLNVAGRLQPAGTAPPRPQTLSDFQLNQTPLVPVRDAAMQEMLRLLPQAPSEPAQSVALSWRPDGRVLAAYGLALNLGLEMDLYDSATGQQLASFPTITSGSSPSLLWSPDGARLLLLVGPAVTIWQPNLPVWL